MDNNFILIIKILNNNDINYWISNGTLLGIVRDKKLIDWDPDIDICILSTDEIQKKIVNLLINNGFKINFWPKEHDAISFTKEGGRKVDINFYKKYNDNLLYSEWKVYRNKFCALISNIVHREDFIHRLNRFKFLFPLIKLITLIIYKFLDKINYIYISAGYTLPSSYIEKIISIEFNDILVKAPFEYIKTLEYLYGSNWKIPQKNYNWLLDSTATKIKNNRDFGL